MATKPKIFSKHIEFDRFFFYIHQMWPDLKLCWRERRRQLQIDLHEGVSDNDQIAVQQKFLIFKLFWKKFPNLHECINDYLIWRIWSWSHISKKVSAFTQPRHKIIISRNLLSEFSTLTKNLNFFLILNLQENYNKKIAPFSFDKVNDVNIPVNINVSMSVIDIIKIAEVTPDDDNDSDHADGKKVTYLFNFLVSWMENSWR